MTARFAEGASGSGGFGANCAKLLIWTRKRRLSRISGPPRRCRRRFCRWRRDGLVALEGDGAGDGFDDAEDGVVAFVVGLAGLRAAGHVGADLVDEVGVAV